MTPGAPAVWVAPSGPTAPERLLRFSLTFSRPQAFGLTAPVSLTGRDGRRIEGALASDVLWSPDRRIATVILDPARVKTGLLARGAKGPVLVAGEIVEVRLGGRILRRWRVVAGGCSPPDPARWRIRAPATGGRRALAISFPTPIDALSKNEIGLFTEAGVELLGRASLGDGEREWRFRPARPWRQGVLQLVVADDLETPCGDQPSRPFESRADDASTGTSARGRIIRVHLGEGRH